MGARSKVAAAPGPTATGTVTGPMTAGLCQVGRGATVLAGVLLAAGLLAVAAAVLTPARLPVWAPVSAVLAGLGATLGLSVGEAADGAPVLTRIGRGLRRAARPRPLPVLMAGIDGRVTRVERFDLVDVGGNRTTCEFLGPRRKRAPERGAIADVWGRRQPDGAVLVSRMVYATDGATYRPRAHLGFSLARLGAGVGTVVGAVLLLVALLAMTVRGA